jgi:hypothetical protein
MILPNIDKNDSKNEYLSNYILNNIVDNHILLFNDQPKIIHIDNVMKCKTLLVKLDSKNNFEDWIIGFEWMTYIDNNIQTYKILSIYDF